MNAERLLEHFEQISDAADAVPRLRRFVLDLAVQGRLAWHDHGSPTHGRSVKARSFPNTEVWQIPTNWAFVELQQLAGSTGLFIDGDWVESKDQDPNGSIRLTQLADVGVGTFRDRSARFMNEETAARLRCTFLVQGDVLIARMPDPLGRACIFPGDKRQCVTVVDVAILRPELDGCDPTFLVHAINSPLFAKNVAAKAAGTTRSRISRGNLAKLPFPLPPLAEQHRIVAKVDELMALCDRLEAAQAEREARRDRLVSASLARVTNPDSDDAKSATTSARFHLDHFARLTTRPEHVKQLRQTILNLAVRGRLVAQDPGDQPVATVSTSSIPDYTVPSSWTCPTVAAVLNGDSQNGYSKKPDEAPDGFPILRISAGTIRPDGIVGEEEYKLIGGITDVVRNQYAVMPGDLLACRFNGNKRFVGRLTLFRGYSGKSFIYPDKLIRLRVNQAMVLPDLLRYFGESDLVRAEVEAFCATTVGNWGISATNLKLVRIPLPPLAEQRRIVAKVDELMALCDQLEASLASAATGRARLLEALLHEALAPAA